MQLCFWYSESEYVWGFKQCAWAQLSARRTHGWECSPTLWLDPPLVCVDTTHPVNTQKVLSELNLWAWAKLHRRDIIRAPKQWAPFDLLLFQHVYVWAQINPSWHYEEETTDSSCRFLSHLTSQPFPLSCSSEHCIPIWQHLPWLTQLQLCPGLHCHRGHVLRPDLADTFAVTGLWWVSFT